MTRRRGALAWGVAASLLLLALRGADALAFGGDRAKPIIHGGATFYSGDTSGSLQGSTGYYGLFRAQPKRGTLRWSLGVQLEYARGLASIAGEQYAFDMFGTGVMIGTQIYLFQTGRILPYIGLEGYGGWNLLRAAGTPDSVEANSSSLTYGALISAGVELRFGRRDGDAIRVESGYLFSRSSLASQSPFTLSGFRISIGYSFD